MAAPSASPAGELVVATDIRGTLFRRALTLLDDVHAGLEEFGGLGAGTSHPASDPGNQQLALVPAAAGAAGEAAAGVIVPHAGGDVLERLLTSVVQGRTDTARRAVDAVAQIHSEIDSIISSFEREFPAQAEGDAGNRGWDEYGWDEPGPGQPSEEVLQMAAATTAAAARFRVRAAEAAQKALQLYDAAAKQAAAAAQATTRALELQASAEQHSAEGNLPQALEDIREANRLREESVEAARKSRQLQQEYLRQRKEAQEAHAQADAAMRRAYSLEHDALAAGLATATRDRDQLHERFDGLLRQAEGLQGQAVHWDAEAEAAVNRAEQAQQEADAQIAAGNYELGNALMQEAVQAQEHAGYARQQASVARDAAQRLQTDVRTARERLSSAEQVVADLSQRQAQLQEATTKQRQERLQEEAAGLVALCQSAEGATALHEQLVAVYEERLTQDQQQYDVLMSQGKTAEAEGLAVHINTWRELLDVARQNRDTSRTEAASMRTRLQDLSTQALMGDRPAPMAVEGSAQGFEELRGAPDRAGRARQAARVLARDLASAPAADLSLEEAERGADILMLQTDLHRHRTAMLAQQLQAERRRLPGSDASSESQQQAEALLDSMAVSHLVGALEASRLLQLWKQRSEQASSGAEDLRRMWQDIEQAASAQEDEAVRLEEQALRLHDAGQPEEAAATMAQAEELHRTAEQLRVEADRARAALHAREKATSDAQEQQRALLQGLQTVERAAERLQAELQQRGFDVGAVAPQDSGARDRQLATQEETATVMMASPSMLSRNSSTATLGAGYGHGTTTGSPGPRSIGAGGLSGGGSDQPSRGGGPEAALNTPALDTARPLMQLGRTSLARGQNAGRGGDGPEGPLLQELEAHAAVEMPEFPASRWDGYSALIGALEASAIDAEVLVAVATSTSNLQLDAQNCGGLAEQQQQRDAHRLERWKSVAAALPAEARNPVVEGVVERTNARCGHVLAAASLLVEALELQGECHGTLSGTLNSYRRALAGLHSAQEDAQAARAEAMTVQAQAQDSLGMDAALLAQVQQLEAELSNFEAEGAAAQALTTRFDLQRLQNKHMEAASQAGQLHAAYEAARQRAEQSRKKEAEASAVGQTLNSVAMLHAKAATEADEGVRYALEAYSNAVSALVVGARDSIAQLSSGAHVEETEAQLRTERLTGSTSNSRRCMAAARQLHDAAGAESAAGAGRIAAAVEQAATDLGVLSRQAPPGLSDPRMREAFGSNSPAGISGDSFTRRSQLADSSSARSLSPSRSDAAPVEGSALMAGAYRPGSGQPGSSDPAIQALQAIESELDRLHRRHQQDLDGLSSDADPDGSAAAEEMERQAVRQELQGLLREAEQKLESVRRQHESMRDPTPAEMQASYDLLQSHEQQVAMLQHALTACDELSRGNLRRARAAARGAELQVRYCEDVTELLKRAAETSRNAIAELESALQSARSETEAEALRQRLQDVHGMAEDVSRRQGDVAVELKAALARRNQLTEQLASEELAAQLREEWLQQARKAAAAAVTATAWEKRLAAARLDVEQLTAPVGAQQDKIKASGSLAQTMKAAAAQHCKQAADITRQAAEQREEARRLANRGLALEAESVKSMADSLQQQADGLTAQSAQMEEDARKLRAEAEDMERATGRSHILAAAKSDVLQHVASAHQLAITALHLRRSAAGKFNDAAVKHNQAAHQQAQLTGVDDELASLEAQMSGGGLRPSELATHMINIARTKQQASALRSALRATQQQVSQDRDTAMATARDAAKVEEQLAQIEPKIAILEQQAVAAVERQDSFFEASALSGGLSGTQLAEGGLQRIPTFGPQDPVPHASLSHASAALAGQASGGDGRGSAYEPLAGRPLLASPLASQRESASLPLRNSPGIGSEHSSARLGLGTAGSSMDEDAAPFAGKSGTVFGLAGASGSQRAHLQRSTSATSPREGGSGQQQDSEQPPRFTVNIGGLSGLQSTQSQPTPHAGSGALNVPLARLKRGGGSQQRQGSNLGPTAAGGASGVQLTPQGSPSPLSRTNSRTALDREGLFEAAEDPRSQPSNASMAPSSRAFMRLPEVPSMPQRQPYLGSSPAANIMSPLGSPRARDRGDGEEEGSAGALLDKVARHALRPLSNVKVSMPPGAAGPGAKLGTRERSASGGGGYSSSSESEDSDVGPACGGGGGAVERRLSRASLGVDLAQLHEEQTEEEDEDQEPDTKMYRTAKQRLEEVEARILALRRQGDTANTAAEILGRKQEQLRMDMEEAREGDSAQRAALLSHGDAMIRLKESEGSLCHKQADMLEDEAAACHDALHYATVDWRIRRELHRREERCDALTSKAQALAMEAQGYEADVADTTECVSLATFELNKAQADGVRHNTTMAQQRLSLFIEEQQRRLEVAKRRAADSRAGAARLATIARDAVARRQLCEKKSLCNKALYQSAVELADACEQKAKVAAQAQHYRLVGLKAAADAIGARVQQLDTARDTGSNVNTPTRGRGSMMVSNRPALHVPPEVMDQMARLADAAADCIQGYLEEMTAVTPEAISVLRRRTEAISALMQLHQDAFDGQDHLAQPAPAPAATAAANPAASGGGASTASGFADGAVDMPQQAAAPPTEAQRRAARITAAEAAVHGLDRACAMAADLRAMCVEAAAAQGVLCDARSEPSVIQAQLLGHKDSSLVVDMEEVAKQQQRLAVLEVQMPLARDQLGAALQAVEYDQAAAKLAEARHDLGSAATAALEAAAELHDSIDVRREALEMLRRHMTATTEEARMFRAGGNLLQATAADEAVKRLAADALMAEGSLAALVHESQLRHEEAAMAKTAAEELKRVAEGSSELAALLLRIVDEQQEARAASGQVEELSAAFQRLEAEAKAQQKMAEACTKQAESLQHQSLQLRTDLKFSAADAHLAEARQCRADAQEHLAAAAAAKQGAAGLSTHLKATVQYRDQLLREVRLLHSAAGHLQEALTCMRDKHHLVRKLRDVEHQLAHRDKHSHALEVEVAAGNGVPAKGKVAEADVLRTQLAASNSTIQHHLASKASFLQAASHLRVSMTSIRRSAECGAQADATMQEVLKARLAAATTGTDGSDAASPKAKTGASEAGTVPDLDSPEWQLQQAELRYRCLQGSISALAVVAAAAERACDARRRQVHLSDQAAGLVSDLAAKILEAEANADEAAGLEASVRAAGGDEEDEEMLKTKLMVNALLQKAETYRGEAAALQGRILQLQQEERAADKAAVELESADHRHTLEALDLTARIGVCREQESVQRAAARAQALEVDQLDREATGLESKAVQLRQQLTNASHSASAEDVANLMLVSKTMGAKAVAHRALQQQRKRELEGQEAECGRMAGDIALMAQRAEHVLRASETQAQVREMTSRIDQLRTDLAAAQSESADCSKLLDELREQSATLQAGVDADGTALSVNGGRGSAGTAATIRASSQAATTQAAVVLAEQMLQTHQQRVDVLQAALAAWESAKTRQEAVLRQQEQAVDQAEWRVRVERLQADLKAAAVAHTEKAKQLRGNAGKGTRVSIANGEELAGLSDAADAGEGSPAAVDPLKQLRAQAAAMRTAADAAHQHVLAASEEGLAARAAALAEEVSLQADRIHAAMALAAPMAERLAHAANTAISAARLQMACVGICSDLGAELAAMHAAMGAVRGIAGRIQDRMEAAERQARAGQALEAAEARGQAAALQAALQAELQKVQASRKKLAELEAKMRAAQQELQLTEDHLSQAQRPAGVAQTVAEYVHQACDLYFKCAERQPEVLRLVQMAAEAQERAEVAQHETRASKEAVQQHIQAGKGDAARVVERAAVALQQSMDEAQSDGRRLTAQADQESDACAADTAAAELYGDVALLSVRLLQALDLQAERQAEHDQLAGGLEALQRTLHSSKAALVQRRGEMQTLGAQIEAHRVEALMQRQRGNDAQACVRIDAAEELTSQLADVADEAMRLERRCEVLGQKQIVMSSLCAKGEALVEMLAQLARLCSAGVGHLMDARDAHDSHAGCLKDAARVGVSLSRQEEALASAEGRLQELHDSAAILQRQYQEALAAAVRAGSHEEADEEDRQDPEQLLHAARTARAGLLIARRQRTALHKEALATRNRLAAAETAVEICQLRINKARQRGEDAQRLVSAVLTLLDGSGALSVDSAEVIATATKSSRTDIMADGRSHGAACDAVTTASPRGDTEAAPDQNTKQNHGVLAAAQLHSVTLQAVAEAVSRHIEALETAAAAEQARGNALAAMQAAGAAREASDRQGIVIAELRRAATGASLAHDLQRLELTGHTRSTVAFAPVAASAGTGQLEALPETAEEASQLAVAAAEIEMERLQHETAYLEATAAQEQKLVSCLEQQHGLLRRASDSLLDMARFGIAAELSASPHMSAYEAASLLAACKQLSQQHAVALMLDAAAVQRYPTSGERAAAQTALLLAEHDALLAEEEQLLQRVQQLDDEAARRERELAEQMHAFGESGPASGRRLEDPDTPSSGTERAQLDADTERLQELTRNMLLRQQDLLREQYQEQGQLRERDRGHGRALVDSSRAGASSGDIDADLLAMAAAAVARAKAAAAELAGRDRPRQINFVALAPPPVSVSPQRGLAVGTAPTGAQQAAAAAAPASQSGNAGHPIAALATARVSAPSQPQHAAPAPAAASPQPKAPGVYITDMASLRSSDGNLAAYPALASTAAPGTTAPPQQPTPGMAGAASEIDAPQAAPLTARVTYPTAELAPQELQGPASPPSSTASSLLAPPSTSQGAPSSSHSQRGGRPWDAVSTPGPAPGLTAYLAGAAPSSTGASEAAYGLAGEAHAADQRAVAHALEGVRPETPLLVRLPLPDDLNSIAAEGLQQLWSGAALHYARAQHMHEGAILQLEQQWERCQTQLQVLQAEEMRVRAAGRIAEAEAVASAAVKWRQRAAHLHAAMKRHGMEAARHKSLARRATSMGERLHVLSAATTSAAASTSAGLEAAAAVTELRQAGLVPQLPTSVLAASPMVQGLERLQAALTEQIASLHTAAAGLQLQSQRTFAKANSRSKKLQLRLGSQPSSAAHAAALHKSHAYAEQAALLGERAVEQATQSRELGALADRLSGESSDLGQVAERLQRAMEQELRAQQALVQAADLALCEAMQAALFGAGLAGALASDGSAAAVPRGDLDSLLTTGYALGVCAAAAEADARRGEDLAQEALRAVQGTKEALEARLATFARVVEDVAGALSALAARRSAHRESLLAQVAAATTCVARANAKAAGRRNVGDVAAAEKYAQAAEGWAQQADKLVGEARSSAAAAEDLVQRAQALSGLSGRVRPLQAALDRYLDEQLDAWAAAALERVHLRGL
ncbi:hypothetical protein HXX76_008584 [Chlamydomonas incerta]|uniref:Uncharacterized protein n=1 Tax=Chlamydomonas incerta TaxID=51695 RepID=A0A835W1P5_CHLIN|nr:hypothetical protein HXX76_008584 [Chlamydomonas incerta]|eukprot:KAG2432851.1 hypothetical protein HXX76_008584 [Chlamydomonas incerta]